MTEDPHFGFVVAAYLVGFLVVGGMTAAVMKDYANLKRALQKFAPGADADRSPDGPRPAQGANNAGESSPRT
ncbi:heme exporter protein CcmD [Methylocapsa palsarum]|uniref:Heme exporter protein D n=1 Tax=Methylocapsa palsarum TaxID=1612308 RepID=A0A1I4BHJ5_9HYPH|nr:heme exporter protein CcmD [Methylocapsa palsarum]SFK68342.1 heme exporter protein D [Methylocapsa palsarum]